MPIERASWDVWDEVYNPQIQAISCPGESSDEIWNYSPYKLHISIHPKYFYIFRETLNNLLDDATKFLLITGYKVLNVDPQKFKETSRTRNVQYTLYLHNNFRDKNLAEVFLLCKKIESILHNIPPGEEKYLTLADLKLSTHIRFRQAARNGKKEYISAKSKFTQLLAEEGKRSKHFEFLYEKLKSQFAPIPLRETIVPKEKKIIPAHSTG